MEPIKVNAENVGQKIKDLIKEGNAKKITVKNEEGKVVLIVPVTVGVVGIIAAPLMAAVGALVGVSANFTLEIE